MTRLHLRHESLKDKGKEVCSPLQFPPPRTLPTLSTTKIAKSLPKRIRLLAVWIVVLLPFQNLPRTLDLKWTGKTGALAQLALYSDEILTFALILLLVSWLFIRDKTLSYAQKSYIPHILLLFIFICITATYVNNISLYRSSLAIFDYSKNIVIAIVFYWLGFKTSEFKRAVILFVNIGIIVAVIGIAGEVLVLFTDSVVDILVMPSMRFGFHRVTSVAGVGAGNYIGMYILLVYWMLTAMKEYFQFVRIKQCILFVLILFTASRQTWIAFLLLFLLLTEKKQLMRWLLTCSILLIVAYSVNLWSILSGTEMPGGLDYRQATYEMCIKYISENPMFGVGPGMIGGLAVSFLWSPLYASWPHDIMWFLREVMYGKLDQFWGRLFADVGILGGGLYLLIFLVIGKELLSAYRYFLKKGYLSMNQIGKALLGYMLALFIMGFAGGINAALLAYPFLAFSGIYLSLAHRRI